MSNDPTTNAQTVLVFNGRDDHVALPAMDFDYSQGFTVEAWVRYDRFQQHSRIIDFGNGPGADNVLLANWGTSSNLGLNVLPLDTSMSADGALKAGEWMHLTATIDEDGRGTLYRNGRAVQCGMVQLPANTLREKCFIGRSNWSENAYFAGAMTELRLWNRDRSTEEIRGTMLRRLTGDEKGLVGYWPLNDGDGTTAHDKTPHANHGTLHDCCWDRAPFSGSPAVSFHGTTKSYQIVNPFRGFPSDEITVECWVKPAPACKVSGIVSYAVSGTDNEYMLYNHNDLEVYVRGFHSVTGVTIPEGRWSHLSVTWKTGDGTTAVYLNGSEAWSGRLAAGKTLRDGGALVLAEDQDVVAGKFEDRQAFSGQLSDLRIWSRVRGADEIQADMYRRLSGDEQGLVAYWPLDEGKGTETRDKASGGNHGVLRGADWTSDKVRANLAFKQPAEASSTESGTAASNVVDGQPSGWVSSSGSTPQWWQVDLGRPRQITGCELGWGGTETAFEYSLSSSADGETWHSLVEKAESRGTGESVLHEFQADDVRYFRVTFLRSNTSQWPCLRDVAVFSEALSSGATTREEPSATAEAEPKHRAAAATDAAVTEPTTATAPSATQPTAVESVSSEPTATEPTAVEPAATEPTSAEPAETNAAATEPAAAASVEPTPTAEEQTTSVSIPDETGSESMAKTENQPTAHTQTSTTGEQEPKKKRLLATGLEDYGFWMQWRKTATPKPTDKPFRRGRIWA